MVVEMYTVNVLKRMLVIIQWVWKLAMVKVH